MTLDRTRMTITDDLKDEIRRLLCGDAHFLRHSGETERFAAATELAQSVLKISPEEADQIVKQERFEMRGGQP